MKTRLLFLATTVISVISIASASAAQVKPTDLVNKANEETAAAAEPMHKFNGPVELLQAAEQGDTAAQLEVAILYEYGFNMPDNEVYALAWYLLAADGSAKAVTHRDKLLAKLSPAQVERARKMSKTLVKAKKSPDAPTDPASGAEPAPMAPPPAESAPALEKQ